MQRLVCAHCGNGPEQNVFLNYNVKHSKYLCQQCSFMILNCAACNVEWWESREAQLGPPRYCTSCLERQISLPRLIEEHLQQEPTRLQFALLKAKAYLWDIIKYKDNPFKKIKDIAEKNNVLPTDIVRLYAHRYNWNKAVQEIIWYNNAIGLDAYDARMADHYSPLTGKKSNTNVQALVATRPVSICLTSDDPNKDTTPF